MSNNKEFRLSELPALARKHYLTGFLCFVLCLFLEIWFLNYPPRGVVGTDVIITGSVVGNPLVDFNSLWARILNDDELMLQIIDRAQICKHEDRARRLNFLNRAIRQNLNFETENATLVKISFKRPGPDDVRPFLNYFTDTVVEKLDAIGQECFETRKEKALVQYARIIERFRFVADFFAMPTIGKMFRHQPNFTTSIPKILEELDSARITEGFGRALIGELLPHYSTAQINCAPYFDDKIKILELFPRSPIVITARDMAPTPVQPYYELIFLLVPLAVFIIYVSLLIILGQKSDAPLPSR